MEREEKILGWLGSFKDFPEKKKKIKQFWDVVAQGQKIMELFRFL